MSDDENKDLCCSVCLVCFSILVCLASITFLGYKIWEDVTGRKIMWCEETPNGPIAHYSDDHRALCKACFEIKDSDGASSWAGEGCVPIAEPTNNFTPVDSESDSNPDTGI